jgi:glycosyltransferase involved in cell wall biosynthesis
MIVWFAADIHPGSGGGVARSMQGLAEGLCALGHRTVVVTNPSMRRGGYLKFSLSLAARLLLNLRNPPDWIVARSTDGAGCAFLAKLLSLKTRIAIHNHGWEEYAYELEKRLPRGTDFPRTTWKARLVRFPLLRACLSLCSCCMSGTLSEIRWLKEKYPRCRSKFRYAPNGVDIPGRPYWADGRDAPCNMLALGGSTWKKNLNHAVEVFEEILRYMPEFRLFLIGTGAEKDKMPLVLGPEVTVVPKVLPGEMSRWYTTCPFLISCSRYEGGHSFALLEAMSYACVVISSAIPSSMEVVRNGHNGILITGVDAGSDARYIVELMQEKKHIVLMRQRAYSSAMRNRWERQAKRVERILWTGQ